MKRRPGSNGVSPLVRTNLEDSDQGKSVRSRAGVRDWRSMCRAREFLIIGNDLHNRGAVWGGKGGGDDEETLKRASRREAGSESELNLAHS